MAAAAHASRRSGRFLLDALATASRSAIGTRRFGARAGVDRVALGAIAGARGVSSSAPSQRAAKDKAAELAMIKDLREKTGAPLMDVKKALSAASFDLEAAYAELRTRGLAAASKKAGRLAAEGLVGVSVSTCGQRAAIVEVNAETDFVSRNEQFLRLVADVSNAAVAATGAADADGYVDAGALENLAMPDGAFSPGATVGEAAAATAASVRENIKVRRAYVMTASGAGEVLGHYVHGAVAGAASAGRQAGLVRVSSRDGGDVDPEKARAVANKVAMHAVAVAPRFLDPESIPESVVSGEMAILRAQIEGSGKPASVAEKIVSGKMRKFHEETCLTKQKFVMDDAKTVETFVDGESNGLVVSRFARLKVGEGIEVQTKDFAAEVAATVADTAA